MLLLKITEKCSSGHLFGHGCIFWVCINVCVSAGRPQEFVISAVRELKTNWFHRVTHGYKDGDNGSEVKGTQVMRRCWVGFHCHIHEGQFCNKCGGVEKGGLRCLYTTLWSSESWVQVNSEALSIRNRESRWLWIPGLTIQSNEQCGGDKWEKKSRKSEDEALTKRQESKLKMLRFSLSGNSIHAYWI